MLESQYQSKLISKLKEMFPNAVILKTDPTYIQGFPDILVLEGERWAALECKRCSNSSHRPNQDYYVDLVNSQGGFARFIYPENEDTVLKEMIEEVFYDLV